MAALKAMKVNPNIAVSAISKAVYRKRALSIALNVAIFPAS